MTQKNVVIIGAGHGGLASASIFAQAGFKVTLLEKNSDFGGRAGLFEVTQNDKGRWIESHSKKPGNRSKKTNIFRFDAGPSWYLMPDIFEHYFDLLGEDINNHLNLVKLSPSYQVVFKNTLLGPQKIYGDLKKDSATFEALEPNATAKLEKYLKNSSLQYKIAIEEFLYKNYDSITDFMTPKMLTKGLKMNVLSTMDQYVSKRFSSKELQKILLYHVVFLGASPKNTPALYNIMSHVDFRQGVFYPMGGIYNLTECLTTLAANRGVKLIAHEAVNKINVANGRVISVTTDSNTYDADIVISNADIHYTDTHLLDKAHRQYSERYWKKRVLAPSALLIYLGVKATYDNLTHHNLVFSKDWDQNFNQIFKHRKLPTDPSFYVCNPNKTDPSVAPKDHENLFILVPIGAGNKFQESEINDYTDKILQTLEDTLHLKDLQKNIVYKKVFCSKDFENQFNSYGGSALGFAHTLKQTAIFRPSNQHPKIPNLLYAGANTVPGIGLPMCLISAELAYKRLIGDKSSAPLKKINNYETTRKTPS